MSRCQICGRRIGLTQSGLIRMHHVRGRVCDGSHNMPIEQSCEYLEYAILCAKEDYRAAADLIKDHHDRRLNHPIPFAVTRMAGDAYLRQRRLERRLARIRSWPARFERQMANQGWGDPPPAYLRVQQPS